MAGSSTFYRTKPIGRSDQPLYINGVWRIETEIPATKIKTAVLQPIEDGLGRVRTGDKYSLRTIDLDLILYFPLVELLAEMSNEASQGLAARIEQLLPVAPTEPPGQPLDIFTKELRQLLQR